MDRSPDAADRHPGRSRTPPPPDWPHAFGTPAATAVLRATPEDFQVDEILGFVPDGTGEHLWLQLRKRGANTHWVARQLAAWAGVAASEVGYSGLKDRHAVTVQWFSVPLPMSREAPLDALSIEGVELLESRRHGRKLRRGTHRENRFRLCLRELSESIGERVDQVNARGVPNYFGPQRYGKGLANLAAAAAMFAGRRRRLPRDRRSLLLSAARSCLFDDVLSRRVANGQWDELLAGDAAMLAGSASFFAVEAVDEALRERVRCFDIHPSGPLWGQGDPPTQGEVARLERAVAEARVQFRDGLAAAGLRQERRPLRLRPQHLCLAEEGDGARLEFTLPAGAYATSVVRELVQWREPPREGGE